MQGKLSEARAKRAVILSGVVIVLVDDAGDGGVVLSCR